MFETEVIKDDHGSEDEGKREHLFQDVESNLKRRDVCDTEGAGDVTKEDRDDALGPGNEERSRLDVRGAEQGFVGEHHGNGYDPVKGDGKGDVGHLARERGSSIVVFCRHCCPG